ncbi:hypothetical protein [Tindallia californiensis]|uniref:LPXTG-motif cell wall anchor domain-containing protein n=1 Tax=Tindallia californiensis TaxID=159292 RepID=A0A1H3PSQ7_9FIRM|nr:hypothetical protein [Tindallia californiensis]SDZ03983.1 hypothetical protein SAMN05192546_10765 [Tindallia californiensis]
MKRSYLVFFLVLCYFMVTTIGAVFASPSVENNTENFKIVDWGNDWIELEYDRFDLNEVGLTVDYVLGQTPDPDPVDPDPEPTDPDPEPTDPDPDPPGPGPGPGPVPEPVDPDPEPTDPDPVDPDPEPTDPDPVDPDQDPDPAGSDPDPEPVDPEPVDPEPVDPDPDQDLNLTDPDPEPVDPDPEIPKFIVPPDPESGPSYFILEDPHGVALGRYTKMTTEDGQSFYIDENGIRIGGPRLPQTGDSTPIARWYVMVIWSLLSAFWIFKNERNGDVKNC